MPTGTITLEDGTVFYGDSIGSFGEFFGEIILNTAMTGYQEILTDPSYAGQIIVFTAPHIGNVGINVEDMESDRIWAGGVIMRQYSEHVSNWRSQGTLQSFLLSQGTIALTGVDTRALSSLIRQTGGQKCLIASQSSILV